MYVLDRDAAEKGDVDPTLALLGAQGWELRGLTTLGDGAVLVALQRPQSDDTMLPDAPVLSAALQEPLTAPNA
jgi:hypothetical protein